MHKSILLLGIKICDCCIVWKNIVKYLMLTHCGRAFLALRTLSMTESKECYSRSRGIMDTIK